MSVPTPTNFKGCRGIKHQHLCPQEALQVIRHLKLALQKDTERRQEDRPPAQAARDQPRVLARDHQRDRPLHSQEGPCDRAP